MAQISPTDLYTNALSMKPQAQTMAPGGSVLSMQPGQDDEDDTPDATPQPMKGAIKRDTVKTDNSSKQNTYNFGDVLDQASKIPAVAKAIQDNADLDGYAQQMQQRQAALQGGMGAAVAPLAALSDSWFGTKLSPAAQAQDPQNQMQTILKFKEDQSKRQNDLAKTLLDSVSKLKTGQTGQGGAVINMNGFGGGPGANNNNEANNLFKWHQQLTGDPDIKMANQAGDAAQKAKDLLAQDSTPGGIAAAINVLKSAGLNRITNYEVGAMTQGDKSAVEKMNQYIQNIQSGNFTAQNKEELSNVVDALSKGAPAILKAKQDEYAKLAKHANISDAAVNDILPKNMFRAQPQAAAPTLPKVGDVVDGHKYKGGNPGDPKSWEAQ
jgi:hypothetical protein